MRQSILQLKVENLGPLAMGTLDLADLTVLCGENNTGKTYLTYSLYGLLKMLGTYIELPEFDIPALRKYGVLEIDLQQSVVPHSEVIVSEAVDGYCKILHRVLAAPVARFNKTHLDLSLNFDGILAKGYHNEFSSDHNRRIISFVKSENSPILTVTAFNEEASEANNKLQYQSLIGRVVAAICFAPAIPKPFLVSTERTGVVMFQGELNLAKSRLIDLAGKMTDDETNITPTELRERLYIGAYPLPVRDNEDFINSLGGIQMQESELLKTRPDILSDFEDLVGGSYEMRSNALYFMPKGTRGVRLQMSESSSAVRSLVILGFYLKHLAAPGELLMIDEPELNLHPANQRKLARLLVGLVNAGVRVFVTTHSDYIVKEFNTLIMWHTRRKQGQELPNDPRYTGKDSLDPEKVRVYLLREQRGRKNGNGRGAGVPTLCEADINPTFGIEVPSFDETIDDMNVLQESLYYGTPYTEKAGT